MTPPIRMVSVPEDVATEAVNCMARAYERVHSLPRVSDTELANRIGAAKEALRIALRAAPVRAEGGAEDEGRLFAEVPLGAAALYRDLENGIRPILATREEAPAEAGEVLDLLTHAKDAVHKIAAARREIGPLATQAQTAGHAISQAIRLLRAQPQAREDAQPVGIVDGLIGRLNTAELDDGTPLYTHPAPDALRAAVEALEKALRSHRASLYPSEFAYVRQALAALQAEQKGGA